MSTYNCSTCGYENEPSAKFCGNCGCDLAEPVIGSNRIGTTILGKYAIRRVVAVGGMGVVYEADQSLGDYHRTVAIKTLRPELSRDQVIVSRFNRECGIVAQLTHQNTVGLYDYGTTEDGTLYIAMEFVRGQSFAVAIAAGALALNRTAHIVDQMCHSLEEAHLLGIVHRDLKPDNVILTHQGADPDFVKLLDFGIAVRLSAGTNHETKLTQKGMILGTPPYMSPEQFTGAPITRLSDVYSLGIIAYEALTGQLPFEADTPWMWAQRHLTSAPPELPSSFPPETARAIRTALSKEPSGRPRSALEFSQMLKGEIPSESSQGSSVSVGHLLEPGDRQRTEPDLPRLSTTASGSAMPEAPIEKTDPAGAPMMAGETTMGPSNVQGARQYVYGNPIIPIEPKHPGIRRRKRGALVALLLGAGILLCAGVVAIAYWTGLIENPFVDNGPPNSLPTFAGSPSGSSNATGQPMPNVELVPNIAPSLPLQNPSQGANSTGNPRATVPARSTVHAEPSMSPTVPSAPSTGPSSSPGGFSLPPFVLPTSLPSLPSLPTSLPPLPSSIAGIPIPQLLPGVPPTPAPSTSSQTAPPTIP
jgi:eukaryotic-like serine/threonine-protein kinase